MSSAPAFATLAAAGDAFAEVMQPPPVRTAWEWAEAHRVLPTGSAEPGPWRTDRVPYARPIMAAFSDPTVERVIVVMGSQMSKSEILINVIGHRLMDGPFAPVLVVQPTEKAARDFSTERVGPMLESVPALARRLARGNDEKVTKKLLGGVPLNFAWAGSATELASKPCGLVLVDERDRMVGDVGDEGDVVGIVEARLDTYANSKLGVFSTPTVEDASAIVMLFEQGAMLIWCWPCLHCGRWFRPVAALLKYAKSDDEETVRRSARVVCPECGAEHEERDRETLNERGHFLPHQKSEQGGYVRAAAPTVSRTRGFMVSGLASPWKPWGTLAVRLAAAYRAGDQSTLQTVINTGFGETFKVRGVAPEWEAVYNLRVNVDAGQVPEWVQLVTMGADVQKDGVFYVIRGWGFNKRSHLIKHGFIYGATEYDDVWLLWQRVLDQQHNRRPLVDVAFVDSGFNPKRDPYKRPSHKVYEVCRRLLGRAFPSKGHDDSAAPPIKASLIDIMLNGRMVRNGTTLMHVNTDYFKTWIHAQINTPAELLEQGVRPWTLHSGVDDDYCRQVVAEELVVKPSGHRVWICPAHKPNHYLDCEVLAAAAAVARQVDALPELRPETVETADQAPAAGEWIEDFGDQFWSRYR